MDKKGFKIGDKVKLKDPKQFCCGAKILTIIDFVDKYIYVTHDGITDDYFPLYPYEIEYVIKKGEQLKFSFMGDN